MIVLDQVAKAFVTPRGAVEALADVNLTIEEGEFVCLVGPSGCGKTTLLHLVAGLEQPDSGAVRIDQREVCGPGPDRGVLFQESALFPWLTVLGNVEFGLIMQGVPRSQRRARSMAWLQMARVAPFAEAFIHELSGGMRQRVALARALALEPAILLMDEPFAALDIHSRAVLHAELERIWLETRKTIIFVTHDIGEAVRLGSRVIVLGRRPARVRWSFPVVLGRPRSLEDAAVRALCGAVGQRIDDANGEEIGSGPRGTVVDRARLSGCDLDPGL